MCEGLHCPTIVVIILRLAPPRVDMPLPSWCSVSGGMYSCSSPPWPARAPSSVYLCRLFKLSMPMLLQMLSSMLLAFISTAFVGHMNDPLALSAVVLSSSIYSMSGGSLSYGLASAMDTFCGQVRGCKRERERCTNTLGGRVVVVCTALTGVG